jgi:polyhydroxyalkanoate synthesis regulator phasin
MATGKQETEGTLGRLSKRGEEAITRLVDELGKNDRVTDALGRAASAKGKLDGASRRALGQVGLAAADELQDLRKQVERLEKRLTKLEGGAASGSGGKKTAASKTTTRARTKKTTGKATEKTASPAPGRAVGGGTGRGSASGGTAPG